MKEYFETKAEFNPFLINVVETIKKIDRKVMFVYSRSDTIVSWGHSMKLKRSCRL